MLDLVVWSPTHECTAVSLCGLPMWFVSFYRTYGYLNSLTKNQDEARLASGALPVAWLVWFVVT